VRFWVAVEGVSPRRERGRASDERQRARLAKQEPSHGGQDDLRPRSHGAIKETRNGRFNEHQI